MEQENKVVEVNEKKRKGITIPNLLTLLRIAAVPAIIIIAIIPWLNEHYAFKSVTYANIINVIIFAVASATDFLDGKIARKYNLVTTFGKFADPLADKMIVLTTLLILMDQNKEIDFGTKHNILLNVVPMWAVAIILLRELAVSGIRLVAAERGVVIAAGWSGKVKTFETMIAIILVFFAGISKEVAIVGMIGIYISVVLTVYSGIVYLYNARKLIFESI